MKATRILCVLLTLAVVLLGVQTLALYQETQRLHEAEAQAMQRLERMDDSLGAIAETCQTFNSLWSRLNAEDGLLGFLK